MIANDALVDPADIVTDAGTWAAEVLLLCRATTAPPEGAAPFRVTVPVDCLPPTTVLGVFVTDRRDAAFTVNGVVCVTPYVPEIVTEVLLATGLVVIVKLALVNPAATVMLDGTCAAAVLLL